MSFLSQLNILAFLSHRNHFAPATSWARRWKKETVFDFCLRNIATHLAYCISVVRWASRIHDVFGSFLGAEANPSGATCLRFRLIQINVSWRLKPVSAFIPV